MRRAVLMLSLLLCCSAGRVPAQAPPTAATPAPTPAPAPGAPLAVTLGDSAVELGGLWKFHTGDDPAWREPGFDDSSWPTLDLTPSDASGMVPGWTATGYPNHSGFAWYRLHVDVSGAKHGLALKMPAAADDAYQVFVNGQLIGNLGKFRDDSRVIAYSTLPREFRLPKSMRNGPLVIAVRMWMDSATPYSSPDAGGMHMAPVLGYASTIANQTDLDWVDINHQVGTGFLEALILAMALAMALVLWRLDPDERAYPWIAIVTAITLAGTAVVLLVNYTTLMGQTHAIILTDVLLTPLRIGAWVIFWGFWFRLARMRRLFEITVPLVLALIVATAMLRPPLYGQNVPVRWGDALLTAQLIVKLIMAGVLLVVGYYGLRRKRSEGWVAVLVMVLSVVANYQKELRQIHIPIHFKAFDFQVSLGTISAILSLLMITVMLLRRFILTQRLKEQWKLEIDQAREVQQIIIPAELPRIAGLSIESEYRPAREVGGDFFQILPGATPGAAFIAVGDVTGKGMQAGMLVALIVGAIRAAAQHSDNPATILAELNDELCEREHASATCILLSIAPDGSVQLANAGQIPPYLNNQELETHGALPLGTIPGMEYDLTRFQLHPGDTLTLMSDGIAEAQNEDGILLGFDRVHNLLQRSITASELAAVAQKWGQEDDILVLRIHRESVANG